jgi:hypothetical protein
MPSSSASGKGAEHKCRRACSGVVVRVCILATQINCSGVHGCETQKNRPENLASDDSLTEGARKRVDHGKEHGHPEQEPKPLDSCDHRYGSHVAGDDHENCKHRIVSSFKRISNVLRPSVLGMKENNTQGWEVLKNVERQGNEAETVFLYRLRQ